MVKFSVLRLLLLTALVAVWLGLGAVYHATDTTDMPTPLDYLLGPAVVIVAIAFVLLLIAAPLAVAWYLSGLVERFMRKK